MSKILIFTLFLTTFGCSFFQKGHKERSLQTKIVQKLENRQKEFFGCSKATNLYEAMGQSRIRILLSLRINDQGKIDKFSSKTPNLPESFLDCVFKIIDTIKFPELDENEAVEIEQPLIFIKR
jgi:hypothetical protein